MYEFCLGVKLVVVSLTCPGDRYEEAQLKPDLQLQHSHSRAAHSHSRAAAAAPTEREEDITGIIKDCSWRLHSLTLLVSDDMLQRRSEQHPEFTESLTT